MTETTDFGQHFTLGRPSSFTAETVAMLLSIALLVWYRKKLIFTQAPAPNNA